MSVRKEDWLREENQAHQLLLVLASGRIAARSGASTDAHVVHLVSHLAWAEFLVIFRHIVYVFDADIEQRRRIAHFSQGRHDTLGILEKVGDFHWMSGVSLCSQVSMWSTGAHPSHLRS